MPSPCPAFVAHCLELLASAGAPRARRMFGGHGLYLDDLFVAIVADEQLFLKVDETTRPDFEAAGGRPFVYEGKGRTMTLGFWTPPDEALESPGGMVPWARRALASALRARAPAARKRAVAAAAVTPRRPRSPRR
jgi:DNA transformation protein